MPDLLHCDIVASIHPAGCMCGSCEEGTYSVPLDDATSEDFAGLILGRTINETGLPDHEARRIALDLVRHAREEGPSMPGVPCPHWSKRGHKGHHWVFMQTGTFWCLCGASVP